MHRNPAVVMRLVASAYAVAERAGSIVRNVLQSGDLCIVEKVSIDLIAVCVCLPSTRVGCD